MKNLFKLGLTLFGFALACAAFSMNASANALDDQSLTAGGCDGSGYCGTTRNGTHLSGKWREASPIINRMK